MIQLFPPAAIVLWPVNGQMTVSVQYGSVIFLNSPLMNGFNDDFSSFMAYFCIVFLL